MHSRVDSRVVWETLWTMHLLGIMTEDEWWEL